MIIIVDHCTVFVFLIYRKEGYFRFFLYGDGMESVLRSVECSNFPIRFEIAIPRFQTHFWDTCFKPIFPYQ